MSTGEILGLVSIVLTAVVGIYVARVNGRTTDRKTATDGSNNAGELALKIAQRADAKVDKLETRLARIQTWYKEQHEPWDDSVYNELTLHDSEAAKRIGRPTPMPED